MSIGSQRSVPPKGFAAAYRQYYDERFTVGVYTEDRDSRGNYQRIATLLPTDAEFQWLERVRRSNWARTKPKDRQPGDRDGFSFELWELDDWENDDEEFAAARKHGRCIQITWLQQAALLGLFNATAASLHLKNLTRWHDPKAENWSEKAELTGKDGKELVPVYDREKMIEELLEIANRRKDK